MRKATVTPISKSAKQPKPEPMAPWTALGFESERDMLIDDLRVLDRRIKDPGTTATAVSSLSKRKNEVFEQIKALDGGDDPDDILSDAEDEAWDVGS